MWTDERHRTGRRASSPSAYLGGVAELRVVTTTLAFGVVVLSTLGIAYGLAAHDLRGGLLVVALTTVAALLLALVARVHAFRRIVLDNGTWSLVPLVGAPVRMALLVDLYERGEDVVAVDVKGRSTVLGIETSPFHDGHDARRTIVSMLRHCDVGSVASQP